MAKDYTPEFQKLLLELMIHNHGLFARIQNIYNPQNFHKSLTEAADFIGEYAMEYNSLPSLQMLESATGTELRPVENYDESFENWFLDEFEKFTRKQELSRAVYKAADMLEDDNFDPVEKLIVDAVQISLTRDMGTDYFADPKARLLALKNNNGQVSTGWLGLDRKLYGGFNKGELNVFAGGSGSGKSLFLQNLACNWIEKGLNGVYITLELSEQLSSMRIDSMLAGVPSKQIFKDVDNVSTKIAVIGKKSGNLRVKYLPAQSTVNDIRAYLRELHIQTGKRIDFLLIDYLDLIMPVSVKVAPSDVFIKDKYVSEELRNLANELGIVFVTASQLNRSAVEEVDFDHSMIAGGISKINTADNVFGIFTSRSMREHGRYQLQLMKTRSSSGVGQKVELSFDIDTLRIVDTDDVDEPNPSGPPSSAIMAKIKKRQDEEIDQETGEITKVPKAEAQSSKLKNMLNGLKKKDDNKGDE
jgi:archaellum biogenesis ATPase FlaH